MPRLTVHDLAGLLRQKLALARQRRRPPFLPEWAAWLDEVDLEVLEAANRHLLQRYATIQTHSMSLPFFVAFPWGFGLDPLLREVKFSETASWRAFGRAFAVRPLVRAFVESHIARKLGELDRLYLYISEFTGGRGAFATWLDETRPDLAEHAARLHAWTSWTSLLRLVGVPALGAAIGLVGAISGDTLVIIYSWFLTLVIYLPLFGGYSFAYKRSLFLGDPLLLEEGVDKNTYRAEEHLWDVLGRRRTLEAPIDLLYFATPLLTLGIAVLGRNVLLGNVLVIPLGVVLTLAGIAVLSAARFREWR
jgi:hypothetical protein